MATSKPAKQVGVAADGRRKRMTAEQRRHTLLEAARKTFAKTGDPTATTMKAVAAAAGISESIIYRHFESKEQLYFEAIVEPLTDAISSYVEDAARVDAQSTEADRDDLRRLFWRNFITSLKPTVPLLGLVLFGEPDRARQFYRAGLTPAVEMLATRWSKMFGKRHPSRAVALSVLGIALMFAVDARFNRDFDLESAVDQLNTITRHGFWPET